MGKRILTDLDVNPVGDEQKQMTRRSRTESQQATEKKTNVEPLLTGHSMIDVFAPLVKNGINLIVIPRRSRSTSSDVGDTKESEGDLFLQNLCQDIARFQHSLSCADKPRHLIYAHIFENPSDAAKVRSSIVTTPQTVENQSTDSKVTIVAGNTMDSHFFQWRCAVTASELAQYGTSATTKNNPKKEQEVIVMYPNGHVFNEQMNRVYEELGALGAAGLHQSCLSSKYLGNVETFEHLIYDCNLPSVPAFYKQWGIDLEKKKKHKSVTYIIGLEMEEFLLEDLRTHPSTYFPWCDSIVVFDNYDMGVNVPHSLPSTLLQNTLANEYANFYRLTRQWYNKGQVWKQFITTEQLNEKNHYKPTTSFLHVDIEKFKDEYDTYTMLMNKCNDKNWKYKTAKDITMALEPMVSQFILESKITPEIDLEASKQPDDTTNVKSILKDLSPKMLEQWFIDFIKNQSKDALTPIPTILSFALKKHEGLKKQQSCRLKFVLYSNSSFKEPIEIIGDHLFIKINNLPVKLPKLFTTKSLSYKNEEKKLVKQIKMKMHGSDGGLTDYIHSAERFGLTIFHLQSTSPKNRYGFLVISGICKEDITNITLYSLSFDVNNQRHMGAVCRVR
ncbi:hypothetical protein RFI_24930 [Reticulomyxa filosa]|uniref:Uncharacterized protein n=1 Tax=Reticulomyxa filosa TaxID=46433 RepID=X6MF00_RETFI|nr:hypothetical protein RFI_24930 [Reticulomyxa filosa]|eukprot:ETO12449.1 hypothetical protein RFI_24930 [Reticulomyxa filosa]